jgi:hypothetical protein
MIGTVSFFGVIVSTVADLSVPGIALAPLLKHLPIASLEHRDQLHARDRCARVQP